MKQTFGNQIGTLSLTIFSQFTFTGLGFLLFCIDKSHLIKKQKGRIKMHCARVHLI